MAPIEWFIFYIRLLFTNMSTMFYFLLLILVLMISYIDILIDDSEYSKELCYSLLVDCSNTFLHIESIDIIRQHLSGNTLGFAKIIAPPVLVDATFVSFVLVFFSQILALFFLLSFFLCFIASILMVLEVNTYRGIVLILNTVIMMLYNWCLESYIIQAINKPLTSEEQTLIFVFFLLFFAISCLVYFFLTLAFLEEYDKKRLLLYNVMRYIFVIYWSFFLCIGYIFLFDFNGEACNWVVAFAWGSFYAIYQICDDYY